MQSPDGGERAVNTTTYTTREIERIARAAFELARVRQGRLCSVDKANVLVETGGLWRKVVQEIRGAASAAGGSAGAGASAASAAASGASANTTPAASAALARQSSPSAASVVAQPNPGRAA